MKMIANTLSINGTDYVIPGGMTDKEVNSLCAMLMRFRRLDEVYSSNYKDQFVYQEEQYISIRLGTRNVYITEEAAREAREARNAELEAAKVVTE